MKRHYPEEQDPNYHFLKEFQSKRLQDTYDDFAKTPHCRAAAFFFFNRLYSTEDTTERDEAFRKIHKKIKSFLGGDVADSMGKLIELQEITIEMDHRMLELLKEEKIPYDMATYERAYRESDNYQLRVRQIELLDVTIRLVHRISHRFGIGLVLKALHGACVLMGDTRMVDFLQDGYRAFADLKDIEPLARAIEVREQERLDRIFGVPSKAGTEKSTTPR